MLTCHFYQSQLFLLYCNCFCQHVPFLFLQHFFVLFFWLLIFLISITVAFGSQKDLFAATFCFIRKLIIKRVANIARAIGVISPNKIISLSSLVSLNGLTINPNILVCLIKLIKTVTVHNELVRSLV